MLSPLVLLTPLYRQHAYPAGEKEVEMLRFLHTRGFALVEDPDHYPEWNFTHRGYLLGGDDEASALEMAYDGRWFRVEIANANGDTETVEQAGRRLVDDWSESCGRMDE